MEFTLTIALGNDAMQTPQDIAHVLDRAANDLRVADNGSPIETRDAMSVVIRDRNGNTVGSWKISE